VHPDFPDIHHCQRHSAHASLSRRGIISAQHVKPIALIPRISRAE
jgi:hypothetical protein